MKKQLIRAAATSVLGLSLMTGFSAAQSVSIDTTGPHSLNRATVRSTNRATFTNRNNLTLRNTNTQTAHTGEATVNDNTTAGDAMSGAASNDNSLGVSATVDNTGGVSSLASMADPSSAADVSISNTGPHSTNTATVTSNNTLTVSNTNNLNVTNSNSQTAQTGNAKVTDNTTGGSAVSGDASNTNSSTIDLSVSN